jgi:1,2-phenylacetyl-CoA epoxidase PaaB subunit
LFEIVNDHLKKAHQHVDSVIAAREKEALEMACNNASDSEVEEQESDDEENSEEALFFHSDASSLFSSLQE